MKLVLEFNFNGRGKICCSAMQVHLTYYMGRDRFDTSPKRETISCSVKLLRDFFHTFNRIFTKSLYLSSSMLIPSFLVLISDPSCV